MPLELGRRLITAGLVPPEEVEAALFLAVHLGIPFARALIDRGAITERALDEELDRRGDVPLRQVVPDYTLADRLPKGMCRRLAAVPTRIDPGSGTIDVAAADPFDPHIPHEFAFHLGGPIRVLRASLSVIEEAVRSQERTSRALTESLDAYRDVIERSTSLQEKSTNLVESFFGDVTGELREGMQNSQAVAQGMMEGSQKQMEAFQKLLT